MQDIKQRLNLLDELIEDASRKTYHVARFHKENNNQVDGNHVTVVMHLYIHICIL